MLLVVWYKKPQIKQSKNRMPIQEQSDQSLHSLLFCQAFCDTKTLILEHVILFHIGDTPSSKVATMGMELFVFKVMSIHLKGLVNLQKKLFSNSY